MNLIIVPIGPDLDYNEPHGREKMSEGGRGGSRIWLKGGGPNFFG